MKLTRVIPLILLVVFSLTLIAHGSTATAVDGYPQLPENVVVNQSCKVYIGNASIIIVCPESVLFESGGLEVTINTTDYNTLAIWRSDTTHEILLVFYYEYTTDPLKRIVLVDLPFPEVYNGVSVYGWEYDVGAYYPPENKTYYYFNLRAVAKIGEKWRGTGLSSSPELRPFYLRLRPVTEAPQVTVTVPSITETWNPPEWYDIPGWIEYLIRLLGIFVQGLGVGIYTVALMIAQLISLTPYLVLIIPLHIIASFVNDPASGLKTINFYIGLGRRLYDLFIKVVQAIAQFIQAVKPL